MVDWAWVHIVGLAMFALGLWLGRWSRDDYWCGAARMGVRAYARGRLFWVKEDGK